MASSGATRFRDHKGSTKMTALKWLALDWLPPALVRRLRQQRGGSNCFEGEFASWDESAARCTGYDAEGILDKVLDATLKVKRGEAAFERDSVLFHGIEYAWPVLAGPLRSEEHTSELQSRQYIVCPLL